MNPSDEALKTLDAFVKSYGKDSYVDDALLWKAHVFLELDKAKEADKTLEEIIREHPGGDMRERAIFEQAFGLARLGQTKETLKKLEHLDTLQGAYWRARLMLFPDVDKLKVNKDVKQREKGKKLLRELAEEVPWNYYGYFARELVGGKPGRHPALDAGSSKLRDSAGPRIKSGVTKDSTYKTMQCFKKHKKSDEAAWVLDRLSRKYASKHDYLILAQDYLDLNRPDKSHQLMRKLGLAFPEWNMQKGFPWELSFPAAYTKEFKEASKREKIPLYWLMGLCREESMFDEKIISWAGAVGLCQLLPSTARKKESELLDAKTNIRVGAAHLGDVQSLLKHPLKVIAAYNAGASAVKRWAKENPKIPMDTFVELIPYEQTKAYVKKVSSAWLAYAWLNNRLRNDFYSIHNKP